VQYWKNMPINEKARIILQLTNIQM